MFLDLWREEIVLDFRKMTKNYATARTIGFPAFVKTSIMIDKCYDCSRQAMNQYNGLSE